MAFWSKTTSKGILVIWPPLNIQIQSPTILIPILVIPYSRYYFIIHLDFKIQTQSKVELINSNYLLWNDHFALTLTTLLKLITQLLEGIFLYACRDAILQLYIS